MKKYVKLIALSLMLCLGSFGIGFAAQQPDTTDINVMIKSPQGGEPGKPVVVVRLVRYAAMDPNFATLNSGDAVIWDSTSDDGVTVSACNVSADSRIAGVLITSLQTAESTLTNNPGARNWGYVAVSGRVLARVSGAISAGDMLCGDGLQYGRLTGISSDGVRTAKGIVDVTDDRWGMAAVALAANTSGTAVIPVYVKTEG